MKKVFNNQIKKQISILASNNDINGIKTILNNFLDSLLFLNDLRLCFSSLLFLKQLNIQLYNILY